MKNTIVMKTLAFTVMCVLYFFSLSQVSASTLNEPDSLSTPNIEKSLFKIQHQWQLALQSTASQETRFYMLQSLAKKMFKLSLQNPSNARLQAWSGVMLSSFSVSYIEGRGTHMAIAAKEMLQKAQGQQADILDTSYLQNGMSARHALQMALTYNPSGVDIDKYYGAFITESDSKLLAFNKGSKINKSTQGVTQAIN